MTSRRPTPPYETIVISDFPTEEPVRPLIRASLVSALTPPPPQKFLREQCYRVRREVFCDEQGFSVDLEIDTIDPTATHVLLRLATAERTAAGTLRIYRSASDEYTIGRVALLKTFRAHGLGRALMRAAHAWIVADASARVERGVAGDLHLHLQASASGGAQELKGAQAEAARVMAAGAEEAVSGATVSVKLGSQVPRMGFYARFGYAPEGELYLDEGAPHMYMRTHLPLDTQSTITAE
ncbi:acyl-CoA N-acyltransferase [Vararia minispora EC-137]|uniref:Acyl-CoA N-acyltransferase n=1 Tax=Vararia minispora EC-137 TaxID=1314806 RepID=A0ACB8QN55_9AGAM|nr:acyl-CoA N-acyltransferase [Vararia minispora EC-137]